jgi:hypothetical protein
MSSTAIATLVKMLESLPESSQDRVVDHMRDYIQELQDEAKWDEQFNASQNGLVEAARRAKSEIRKGHAKPMDFGKL